MNPIIKIFDSENALFRNAADIVLGRYQDAVKMHTFFSIALSGGKTPLPLYRLFATLQSEVDWKRLQLFMVDERFVPYRHADSNWGMIQKILISQIDIPSDNCHPIPILGNAQDSAIAYESELRQIFHANHYQIPQLDLMIMGVGADGHTASLFPGSEALIESRRLAIEVMHDHVRHSRITVTFPLIHHAKQLMFLVLGDHKAERIHDILVKKDDQVPATLACRGKGEHLFLLDIQAASHL